MKKIGSNQLHSIVTKVLEPHREYKYISGRQPFAFYWASRRMVMYIKNMSSAYFANEDITRAQLPKRNHFDMIKNDKDALFVFIGYDSFNDVFVTWPPEDVKPRINTKANVSFYSRREIQEKARATSGIVVGYLKDGSKFMAGALSALPEYLSNIDYYFPSHDEIKDDLDLFCSKVAQKYKDSYSMLDAVEEVLNRFPDYSPSEIAEIIERHLADTPFWRR